MSGAKLDLNHPNSRDKHHYDPCIVVIFGGAGDLSHRKLIPALYNLSIDDDLPERFAILGFSMEDLGDQQYREFARAGIEKFSRRAIAEEQWAKFAPRLHFCRGTFTAAASYQNLRERLEALDEECKTAGNRVFYFAIPPAFIDTCSAGLTAAGLIKPPAAGLPYTRVVVEKPIGSDFDSASEINGQLARHFDERQIFRIDHYLGKETVENLMVLRFANSIFEPIWTSRFIDHVQITVAEAEGVGTRASYYDHAGALRDMVQSHLLQTLCMIATEPPNTTGAESVRDAKLDVLRSLRPLGDEDLDKWVVRGQYAEGLIGGVPAKAYRDEEAIAPDSKIETFAALRCWIDNWRWAGVPFYLRTGKRLPKRASEIAIYFKSVPRILYNANPRAPLAPNMLTIRIQPDEGLDLYIMSKVPGSQTRLQQVKVDFHYVTSTPEAYETLLNDVIIGDQTLFMRRDTVEEAWKFVQPILDAWGESPIDPPIYAAGSWGPLEAALMIAADGRTWRTL
ncbi:glucose-6-phosphate dehydrogenase [Candidatus Binatus sp.]|uniref:glucose-6-phosphate dehydrogenase n=1 Tax=Candidatus Binatus sp. TaxID=2811406 RepID=UPI002729BE02|nr:glucose-6-phosphate dehydrogenase [Candidatus Binatus sp.]